MRKSISLTHSSAAYISASAELCAVIVCCLEDQCRSPCKQIIWPDMERENLSGIVGSYLVGTCAIWGP